MSFRYIKSTLFLDGRKERSEEIRKGVRMEERKEGSEDVRKEGKNMEEKNKRMI